jgi:hypothetical protein
LTFQLDAFQNDAFETEVIDMANVKFEGSALPQAGPRATTITVKQGATVVDTLTATTDVNGAFTTTKAYIPGAYVAKASVLADTRSKAGSSIDTPFTVDLDDVIVSLKVTVG